MNGEESGLPRAGSLSPEEIANLLAPRPARAIVRYSINGETSNVTGNEAAKVLKDAGFDRIGTASWEGDIPDQGAVVDALQKLVTILRDPPGGGRLDHLWIYLDHPEET
jgi:hypothetical protein